MVTGLVVNEKINVNRIYYKETRAMAHQLYKQESFEINGEPGTLNKLEGRFAFINQLTSYTMESLKMKINKSKLALDMGVDRRTVDKYLSE